MSKVDTKILVLKPGNKILREQETQWRETQSKGGVENSFSSRKHSDLNKLNDNRSRKVNKVNEIKLTECPVNFVDNEGKPKIQKMSQIPGKKLENGLWEQQCKIAQAEEQTKRNQESRKLKENLGNMQDELHRRHGARALAIRKTTITAKGRKTPGVDKVALVNDEIRIKGIISKDLDKNPLPIKRHWITKKNRRKKRPLGIPTIIDRCKQNLAAFVLEPQGERKFGDECSFGGRKGFRPQDAQYGLFQCLNKGLPRWALKADLKGCFDNIAHEPLLEKLDTSEKLKKITKRFLEAGILEDNEIGDESTTIVPNTKGTPQGGPLSSLLCNIALNGLEEHCKQAAREGGATKADKSDGKEKTFRHPVNARKMTHVVRFVDDFNVIHTNKEVLEFIKKSLVHGLQELGLKFNLEKTEIINLTQKKLTFVGFDFRQIRVSNKPNKMKRKKHFIVKVVPSKENQIKVIEKLRTLINEEFGLSKKDRRKFIELAKPIVNGGRNFFQHTSTQGIASGMDKKIYEALLAKIKRISGKSGPKQVKKIFPEKLKVDFKGTKHFGNGVLAIEKSSAIKTDGKRKNNSKKEEQKGDFLPKFGGIKYTTFTPVTRGKHIFNGDFEYGKKRSLKVTSMRTKAEQELLSRQKGKCGECNNPIFNGEITEKDHIIPQGCTGPRDFNQKELQLLHLECHIKKSQREAIVRNKVKTLGREATLFVANKKGEKGKKMRDLLVPINFIVGHAPSIDAVSSKFLLDAKIIDETKLQKE